MHATPLLEADDLSQPAAPMSVMLPMKQRSPTERLGQFNSSTLKVVHNHEDDDLAEVDAATALDRAGVDDLWPDDRVTFDIVTDRSGRPAAADL